jgi:programmed cell death 6-interacting protein
MFEQDLEVIDDLRRNAINVNGPHDSGLKQTATYAAQLVCIRSKFPIEVCLATKFGMI